MKLHYSQTMWTLLELLPFVSVPYEITLLSNAPQDVEPEMQVSVPYEITLLSNHLAQVKGLQ